MFNGYTLLYLKLAKMFVFPIMLYMFTFMNWAYEASEVNLKLELIKNGFHREIKYSVEFKKNYEYNDCFYLLSQPLPSSVYIMADELTELKIRRKIEITYPHFINTETFSENSESFSIVLKIYSKLPNFEVSLPIHYRYHTSKAYKKSTYTTISYPLMYSTCYADLSGHISSVQTPKNEQNIKSTINSNLPHRNSTFDKTKTIYNCNWILLKTSNKKCFITAEIPVGIHAVYLYISTSTITFSWIIVVYTSFKIHIILPDKI